MRERLPRAGGRDGRVHVARRLSIDARSIGRIQIAAQTGGLSPGTVSWTEHWQTNDGVPMSSCAAQAYASAVFGYPVANGATTVDSFSDDERSRFQRMDNL